MLFGQSCIYSQYCTYKHTHIHAYKHTHIQTYTHTHMHTYTQQKETSHHTQNFIYINQYLSGTSAEFYKTLLNCINCGWTC